MTEPLRPPYTLPGLEALRQQAHALGRTLQNIRITRIVVNHGTYLNAAATYVHPATGAGPGMELALYWVPSEGQPEPEPMLRIGHQTCAYAGPFDMVDAEARGLLDIDWALLHELPTSISNLWELRERAVECWRNSEREASLYAIARLNSTAQRRTGFDRPHPAPG
ncbi:hypothetical protein [Arthrobacter sp. 92]|jgi:hypothetical protein|uniref:hypothetical protein n=1 Tax=Arthrobacter sp. 92 TaxID=3418175 RepID=UPI003D0609C0